MRVEVRASNIPISEPLALHITKRLDFALRRYAGRIDHVLVRLVDLNGPKGGVDKRCSITAQLASPSEKVLVAAVDSDAYVAVSQATARLDSRISRAIRRVRTLSTKASRLEDAQRRTSHA